MKRIALAILFACASLSAPAAVVTLVPSSAAVQPGDLFNLTLQVDDVFAGRSDQDLLLAFGFNVTVADPSLLTYLGATVDPLFFDDSAFFGGDPMVVGTAFPGIDPSSVSGPLSLAVLSFQAGPTPGHTTVSVIGDSVLDLNEGLVFLSSSEDIAARASIQVVPEPAAILLSAAGLGLLLAIRRRRALQ